MIREIRILSYILIWFLLGIIVSFIGVIGVNADTIDYENIGYLSDYTVFYVTSDNPSSSPQQLQQYYSYNLNNVTQLLLYIENYNFEASVVYDLEIYLPLNSIKNNSSFLVTDENYNMCTTYELFIEDANFPRFRFSCSQNTNFLTLTILNETNNFVIDNGNFIWDYTYLRKQVSSVDLGPIIDQNNQIIQGQDEIKDTIKNELNYCRDSYNLFDESTLLNGYFTNGNSEIISSNFYRTIKLNLKPGTYTISIDNNKNYYVREFLNGEYKNLFLYDKDYTFNVNTESIVMFTIRNEDNSEFTSNPKIMINEGTIAKSYEPYGKEICSNKIDETNKELGNINDALTDDSPTDMSSLEDSIGWLPPGPVDSILNLPLALFNSLSNNLSNKTCISIEVELPFINKNITLPCVKTLYDKMGVTGTLFQSTGIIASCFILFNYLLALYHWVDDTLTLRENTMPGYYDDNWGGGA